MKKYILLPVITLYLLTGAKSNADALPTPAKLIPEFCKNNHSKEYASLKRLDSTNLWFEIYAVAPGVTAIYEPHQWQKVISYLIEGEQSALLFDSGNGIGDIFSIVSQITKKPVTVLNSHSHYDHVGGNHTFDNILGMNTSFSRKAQQGIINKNISAEVSAPALCRPAPNNIKPSNHVGKPYQITKFIENGYKIDLGNRILEVIHTPGHAPDAIALIDRKKGLLWTGDTFYPGQIWLHAPETNLSLYRKSLQRLLAELPNIKALLPAHNTPWVEPSVLSALIAGFDTMMSGKAIKIPQGNNRIEYRIVDEDRFYFLMNNKPLPH
jgi:glyoxylase-like metal-dependent hydrolase (beta-lactamase superfamily II)